MPHGLPQRAAVGCHPWRAFCICACHLAGPSAHLQNANVNNKEHEARLAQAKLNVQPYADKIVIVRNLTTVAASIVPGRVDYIYVRRPATERAVGFRMHTIGFRVQAIGFRVS